VRPNLDGPNFGFAHRIGQAAKADAIRKGYAQKAAVSQPTSGNSVPLGVTQQMKIRQHVHREIAAKLFVSENTVKTHSSRLFDKLGAKRRTQAVQFAKTSRLIP